MMMDYKIFAALFAALTVAGAGAAESIEGQANSNSDELTASIARFLRTEDPGKLTDWANATARDTQGLVCLFGLPGEELSTSAQPPTPEPRSLDFITWVAPSIVLKEHPLHDHGDGTLFMKRIHVIIATHSCSMENDEGLGYTVVGAGIVNVDYRGWMTWLQRE